MIEPKTIATISLILVPSSIDRKDAIPGS